MIDFEIGTYGCDWIEFMEENHKDKVRQMKANGTFIDVAKSVDARAWDYRELLEKQYMKAHPYPNTYYENVQYHRTMDFYVRGAVMREIVLIAVTEPQIS